MFFIGCISVNTALAADLPERSEVQSQLTTLNKQKN
jgi:potassium efflux system protein